MNIGDPVTLLFVWLYGDEHDLEELRVARARVEEIHEHEFTACDASTGFTRDLCDEGITWIRGHHDFESDAVKSLLATAALS